MKINAWFLGILLLTLNGCMDGQKEQTQDKGSHMITLPSGLQYTIVTAAPEDAPVAQAGNRVTVHYTGWLENGTKFDSSLDRKQPFQFNLGAKQVIAGWDEGVNGMRIGETRRLIIPAHLGYGSRGAGSIIPANATLIFEVQLLAI